MNNIDILEKMKQDDENFMEDVVIYNLEKFIRYCNNSSNFEYDYDFKQHKEVGYLISTLIAENKELKEEKKNMLETYKKINPEKMKVLADSFNEKVMSKLESDYISKSVIEKEIEEYEEIGMIGVADCMKRLLDERNNTGE